MEEEEVVLVMAKEKDDRGCSRYEKERQGGLEGDGEQPASTIVMSTRSPLSCAS